uniref:Small heat shock protein 21.2 n=1 Tax=Laodelphax striatellus TaxID=195883 RepID=A0A3G2WJH7_LAOST|nr:small heat shock protein 21.2 [Laodelphax striatellus]
MSLFPYVIRDFMKILNHPTVYDQYFALRPSVFRFMNVPLQISYQQRPRFERENNRIPNLEEDNNNFKVNLDVQQFKPEEISVKLSGDNIVIEGKHEERTDQQGFISRHFCHRYKLPDNVDVDKLQTELSSDGILSLVAPKIINEINNNERHIPIRHTNQPALKQKQQSSNEKSEEKMDP